MRHKNLADTCAHVTYDSIGIPAADQNTEKAMDLGMLQAPLSVVSDPTIEGGVLWKETIDWVERGTEVRLEETRRRHGHTTRPMNAFMLYRSANLRRAQIWCRRNNQQFLSALIGRSWALEHSEVRELFKNYAETERRNHREAHASYKFAPKRRKTSSISTTWRRLNRKLTGHRVLRPGIADTGALSARPHWDSETCAYYQTDNPPLENATYTPSPVYRPPMTTAIFHDQYYLATNVDFLPWTPTSAGSNASLDSSPAIRSNSRHFAEVDQQYWTNSTQLRPCEGMLDAFVSERVEWLDEEYWGGCSIEHVWDVPQYDAMQCFANQHEPSTSFEPQSNSKRHCKDTS